ncbi:MAG TPA: CHAP domain-containing protein [Ktedonobacterales bacterium]|nr:CHAP domain-containing protein [Ktedonobacterales bacterium]
MRLRDYMPGERPADTDDPRDGTREALPDDCSDLPYDRNGSGVRSADDTPTPVRSAMRRSSQAAKSYATRTFPAVSATPLDERASASWPGAPRDAWATQAMLAEPTDPTSTIKAPRPAPRRRRANTGDGAQTDPTLATPAAPTRTPRRVRSQAPAANGIDHAPDASSPSGVYNVAPGASAVRRRRAARPQADLDADATLAGLDDAPSTSGRRRRTARPTSAQEQALVEHTTLLLDATEVLNRLDGLDGDDGVGTPERPTSSGVRRRSYAPVSQPLANGYAMEDDPDAPGDPLATRQLAMVTAKTMAMGTSGVHWADAAGDATERLPATFIPGAMTAATRGSSAASSGKLPALASSLASSLATATTLPPTAPRHRRRGVDALMTVVVAAILLGLLGATSPLWRTPLAQVQQRFAPQGAAASIGQINQPPTGPWSSTVSVAPNLEIGGGAGPGVKAPGSAGLAGNSNGNGNSTGGNGSGTISAAPIYPWPPAYAFTAPPGYYSWGVTEPANDYYWWAFGQCTWWAQHMRGDENLRHMGNAQYWAGSAAARGYSVGSTPVVGATVVFQPGVQGAGGAGHVAHVERVYPDGWFLISEMNFYWNGGGWGRVDYRYAHSGWGVQFIY